MGELGSGNGTAYPAALDTDGTAEVNSPNAGKTKARAEVINDLNAAVIAIQTELGVDPAGSFATVVARLNSLGLKNYKSYTIADPGGAGIYFMGGYYDAPAADTNLTQASTTQTLGTANVGYAAHAFLVGAAAGAASGGSGIVEIEVSGTSITDAGVRTGSDTEVIISNITAMTTDGYAETTKKWIGQVTYTLQNAAGGTHTTFNADFNYGFAKYEDFGNVDFQLQEFEIVGFAGNADTGFDINICKHSSADWTYSAAAFVPGGTSLYLWSTDYNTEINLANNEPFAWKRTGLTDDITGSGPEGIIVQVTIGANNAISFMDGHLGIIFT